jgi:hypothetical protein
VLKGAGTGLPGGDSGRATGIRAAKEISGGLASPEFNRHGGKFRGISFSGTTYLRGRCQNPAHEHTTGPFG